MVYPAYDGAMSTLGTPPPSTPAYPDLLVRMRGGDVAAFKLVFRDMHAPLVAFAVRYVNDRARAEELLQDLFFDLWQHRARCQVRNTLRSYLFAALRNRALNLRRRDAVESDWTDDEAHDSVRVLHPTPTPADVLLIAVEERQAIEAAFARLPERCRCQERGEPTGPRPPITSSNDAC